jgi:hypothetical protein
MDQNTILGFFSCFSIIFQDYKLLQVIQVLEEPVQEQVQEQVQALLEV